MLAILQATRWRGERAYSSYLLSLPHTSLPSPAQKAAFKRYMLKYTYFYRGVDYNVTKMYQKKSAICTVWCSLIFINLKEHCQKLFPNVQSVVRSLLFFNIKKSVEISVNFPFISFSSCTLYMQLTCYILS